MKKKVTLTLFVKVQYKIGEDLDLDFHYDDAEVTLNVCLGKEFEGLSALLSFLLN